MSSDLVKSVTKFVEDIPFVEKVEKEKSEDAEDKPLEEAVRFNVELKSVLPFNEVERSIKKQMFDYYIEGEGEKYYKDSMIMNVFKKKEKQDEVSLVILYA